MSLSNWNTVISFSTKVSYLPTSEEAALSASDKASSDLFGCAISISSDGSRVAVGSMYGDSSGIANAGKAYIFSRSGATWTQEAILTASDKATDSWLGYSISIAYDGTRVAVGAMYATPGGIANAGKAYIFSRSGTTWTQEAVLTASDKASYDSFGSTVSISGDGTRVTVGAYSADPGGISSAGKAYVFTRSGTIWTQEVILTASDKAANDSFGYSIDISSDGTRVTVGAMYATPNGVTNAGKVYVFSRSGTTWTQEAILTASDKAAGDYFGISVAIDSTGARVAVGAQSADPGGLNDAGKAYIFVRSGTTWTQEAVLIASDKFIGDRFGCRISIASDGSRVAVGARLADLGGTTDSGKAYVFTRSGANWAQEVVLSASDRAAGDGFGYSVSISGDGTRIAIGAYNKTVQGVGGAGAAYIFS